MYTQLVLKRFKCFAEEQKLPLSQITLLYGLNGRGKSSVLQSLLLLFQSMKNNNSVESLYLIGDVINLGKYTDILNSAAHENSFSIGLACKTENGTDTLDIEYSPAVDTPFVARMQNIVINDQSRSDSQASLDSTEEEGNKITTSLSDSVCLQMLKDINYIAANRLGVSNLESRLGTNIAITPRGENVLNILASASPNLLKEVEVSLSQILSGATLKINNEKEDSIEIYMDSISGSKHTYKPINVGFGYGYILSLVVQTLIAPQNSILVVENPESHLHPGAQSRLMEFLITQSVEKNLQLIIESHSDHIVNGVRIAIRKEQISSDKVSILHFSRDVQTEGSPTVEEILIDKRGNLSSYPEDFMDEWTKQLELLMM